MNAGWSEWTLHTGGANPVGKGYLVQAEMGFVGSGDFVGPVPSEDFDWYCPGDPVARYRIRKPRGLTVLEGLLEDLPEEVLA